MAAWPRPGGFISGDVDGVTARVEADIRGGTAANGVLLRSDAGGTCSVTVTRAAPALGDVIEGTFTATLKTELPSDPRTAAVTNGAFHVTRNFQ